MIDIDREDRFDRFHDEVMDDIERRIRAREDPCRGCEEDMGY